MEVEEMEGTRELWERIGRQPGGRKNPFDDPYGPTTECFSDNDLVRMLSLGAERRYVDHLGTCKDCQTRVDAFAELTGRKVPQPEVAIRTRQWLPASMRSDRWRRQEPSVIGARALVYVPSTCLVKLDVGEVETVSLQLITKKLKMSDAMTVYLTGPFTAEGNLVINELGYPSVDLRNVKASPNVLRILRSHDRLTEQLEVRIGENVNKSCLIGTSNVELTRAT